MSKKSSSHSHGAMSAVLTFFGDLIKDILSTTAGVVISVIIALVLICANNPEILSGIWEAGEIIGITVLCVVLAFLIVYFIVAIYRNKHGKSTVSIPELWSLYIAPFFRRIGEWCFENRTKTILSLYAICVTLCYINPRLIPGLSFILLILTIAFIQGFQKKKKKGGGH